MAVITRLLLQPPPGVLAPLARYQQASISPQLTTATKCCLEAGKGGCRCPRGSLEGTIPPATHISPFDSPQAQGWICEHSPRVLALCMPPAPPEDALGQRSKSSGTCTALRPQENRRNCGGDLILGVVCFKAIPLNTQFPNITRTVLGFQE